MMMMMMMVVVMVAIDPGSLTLPTSLLFFLIARAEPAPFLLIPCAERLATEGEVVILDDSGDHPGVATQFDLACCGICDV